MTSWTPSARDIEQANATGLINELGLDSFEALHEWSITNREAFWEKTIRRLNIKFNQPYNAIVDLSDGVERPHWLPGASFNIVDSCFSADPESPSIIFKTTSGQASQWSVAELEALTNRVANSLVKLGYSSGDALGIDMPMTAESVAIFLGIVRMGGVVASIADSFAPAEIKTRLSIANTKLIFTQDVIPRGGKLLPLYEKVLGAEPSKVIVLPAGEPLESDLREGDLSWKDFLVDDDQFESVACDPEDTINILFSSGTTGDPKAILWTQTSPIKSTADGYYHQDIHPGDIIAWPTNLGWMMGPWLIFASLINRATIALYYDVPTEKGFGEFIQDSKVTMLGLVPSLVRAWRSTGCMDDLDWSSIKLFSSTGECSNADDMQYLMQLAGNRPVIEYCGGTEIGGGHITGSIVQPAYPGTFSTLALGIDAVILDEDGNPCENGELFLVPPSIGLSNAILNRDHYEVYFQDTPAGPDGQTLRRHGDQMEQLPNGYYRAHGRADDTMNLGGIKVSSVEVERTVNQLEEIQESAAIGVDPPGGGPSQLVLYVVGETDAGIDKERLLEAMRQCIRSNLNPLFKIHDMVLVDVLPRTASNKVMRRLLRDEYRKQ